MKEKKKKLLQDKADISFSKNTRKEEVKILMKVKAKPVKLRKGSAKNKNSNDFFFEKSATLLLSSTVGYKTNTGTEVGISAGIILHFLYLHCYKILLGKLVCQRLNNKIIIN